MKFVDEFGRRNRPVAVHWTLTETRGHFLFERKGNCKGSRVSARNARIHTAEFSRKKKTCVRFPQQKRWNQCTIATEIRRKETKMTFRERKMLSVTNGKFPPFCCEKTLRNLWDDETKFVEKNVQAQACQMHLIGSVVVMATAFSQNWGFTCAFDSWSHWPGIKWRMIRVTMATNSEISACRTSLGRYGYRPLTCSSQIIGRLLSSSASILGSATVWSSGENSVRFRHLFGIFRIPGCQSDKFPWRNLSVKRHSVATADKKKYFFFFFYKNEKCWKLNGNLLT